MIDKKTLLALLRPYKRQGFSNLKLNNSKVVLETELTRLANESNEIEPLPYCDYEMYATTENKERRKILSISDYFSLKQWERLSPDEQFDFINDKTNLFCQRNFPVYHGWNELS